MLISIRRVFWSYHSVEKNVKSFSEGPFSTFFYFVTSYPRNVKYQWFSTAFGIGIFDKDL